ncbi:zf-CCHC domain-containing protein [Tanacetum coccineum]|uniref:Zf-CCHC domain-containing protein n=1 Tax=Tanacetum coccineum TaxID=301880 RepID=A0ABQ5B038_9ASTR
MDSDKYLEGQSMQRPLLFNSDCFIYWKNRFETYVKAKDLDLWHIILSGDFPPVARNEDTQVLEVVPFEEQYDDLKKKLAKNNEAKMVLYNALPKKEYEGLKKSSDDETSTSGSDDKEYVMAVRNFKKFFKRKGEFVRQPREEKNSFRQRDEKKGKSDWKCFRCGDLNHLIRDCPKPPRNKDQKAFIGGSWSDSENDAEDKTNDETCLLAQSSNKVTLNSSYYNDNASSLDNDNIQLEYDNLCEISLNIINKNKVLKTKRDLLEKEILELNEKIKKVERNKEIDITYTSCQELKLENARLKETQAKFLKFDKSANSLREMLNNKNLSSCKIGLGFDSTKASTSGTKPINFVGSYVRIAPDGSTINAHGSTIPGSVDPSSGEKAAEHVFSPPVSSRLNFVITRKKLIHNKIEESKKPSLKSGYSQNSKAYAVLNKHTMKVEESLNVTFNESPPPSKLSPLVDDDVGEEESIKKSTKVVNNNNEEDESIEVNETANIKESKNHPLNQVIENLNQRTLRS